MNRGPENSHQGTDATLTGRNAEIATFLTTCFVIFPALAVGFVGAYGLVVWISQMIFGPPGPPG
jgi:nitrate reductase NapE